MTWPSRTSTRSSRTRRKRKNGTASSNRSTARREASPAGREAAGAVLPDPARGGMAAAVLPGPARAAGLVVAAVRRHLLGIPVHVALPELRGRHRQVPHALPPIA